MIYYIIFIILLFLSVVEFYGYIELRIKKCLIFMISLLFIFLSTVRTNVVGDYYSYKAAYDQIIDVSVPFWKIPFIPHEVGYSLFMYLVKKLSGEFHVFLFVQACVVIGLQYKVITYWCECFKEISTGRRRSFELTAYFICWAVYIGHVFSIRNIVAIMICLYALRYVHDKKIMRFIAFVLLGTSMHISVIVFLAVYPMYWINASFKLKMLGFIVGVITFNKILSVMTDIAMKVLPLRAQARFSTYLEAGFGEGSGINDINLLMLMLIKAIANIGVVLGILFLTDQYRRRRKGYLCHRAEYAYTTIYIVGAVLQIVSTFINLAFSRISTSYIYFQFPLFIVFLKTFDRTRWKNIAYAFLITYILLRFAINMFLEGSGYIPFRTIWSEILL